MTVRWIEEILLGQQAWAQIQALPWDDFELGGGCYGRVRHAKIEVEAAVANPHGSQTRTSTSYEWKELLPHELYPDPGGDPEDYCLIVSGIHSHPYAGANSPSPADLENVVAAARAPMQPGGVAGGMIAYPLAYLPGTDDSPDWQTMRLAGYVGHADGRTRIVPVRVRTDVEERRAAVDAELREFEKNQRLLRREKRGESVMVKLKPDKHDWYCIYSNPAARAGETVPYDTPAVKTWPQFFVPVTFTEEEKTAAGIALADSFAEHAENSRRAWAERAKADEEKRRLGR
jgi:hypothetical protein